MPAGQTVVLHDRTTSGRCEEERFRLVACRRRETQQSDWWRSLERQGWNVLRCGSMWKAVHTAPAPDVACP